MCFLRKYTMKDLRDKEGTISNFLSNFSKKCNIQIYKIWRENDRANGQNVNKK